MIVCAAVVAVSPVVVLLAVTVNVATGWSVPVYWDDSVSPVSGFPSTDAPSVIVHVFVPSAWRLLVTVFPVGAVIVSYVGTPLIFTDIVSSESTGVAVSPSGIDPPAVTFNDVVPIVSVGTSAVSIAT